MSRPRTLVPVLLGCLALCGCSGAGNTSDTASQHTVTVTVTQTPSHASTSTVGPARNIWLNFDRQAEAPSPDFPITLDGWRLADSWSVMPRAFTGTWTDVPGPGYTAFPATMNGCDSQLFLLRWRSIAEGAPVDASWTHGPLRGDILTTDAGWMSLDGCQAPQFRVAHPFSGGSNLTDVTVDVQVWTPAP